ncbi:MAG TPA: hypothetical protein PKV76_11290 [Chitinophagales bacterium]|nr:hypothetical protein [Chitinophagales bacterium]
MLLSYKIELIVMPLIAAVLVIAIDVASAPDFIFFDYKNLRTTALEDVVAFGVVALLLNMFMLLFVHLYRTVKLKHLNNAVFRIRRIILLVSNLIFFILLVVAATIDSEYEEQINDDWMALILFLSECIFVIVYYTWFVKESRYVFRHHAGNQPSLLDELQESS